MNKNHEQEAKWNKSGRHYDYMQQKVDEQNKGAFGNPRTAFIVFAKRRGGDAIIAEIRKDNEVLYHVDGRINKGFTEDMLVCVSQKAAEHRRTIEAKIEGEGHARFSCAVAETPDGYRVNIKSIK